MNKLAVLNIYPGAKAVKESSGWWVIVTKDGRQLVARSTPAKAWAAARDFINKPCANPGCDNTARVGFAVCVDCALEAYDDIEAGVY